MFARTCARGLQLLLSYGHTRVLNIAWLTTARRLLEVKSLGGNGIAGSKAITSVHGCVHVYARVAHCMGIVSYPITLQPFAATSASRPPSGTDMKSSAGTLGHSGHTPPPPPPHDHHRSHHRRRIPTHSTNTATFHLHFSTK